ncbi:hypothetical protein [uncultured Maribacter sp.]|uniref:hypothetical protein n=1 Tax=uncultured Maribacter sp. TaxID=431308 RepID=UPI00263441B4|nr:hypothetical protein [uncultured Maribacter sp.]
MNEEDLKYGYWKFYDNNRREKYDKKYFRNVSEYKGEEEIVLACTQQSKLSANEQKKSVQKWCDLFLTEQTGIKKIWITTRISQKIFDAVCNQKSLDGLWIKWGGYKDLSCIENLNKLEHLHLGGGGQIESLKPLENLKMLKTFESKGLYKITNYDFLKNFEKLEDLSLWGDPFSAMKKINIDSLKFLNSLTEIIRLDLCMTKIGDKDYKPILNLPKLKHLTLPRDKDLEEDIGLFSKYLGE